jgi:hypothetical protein
MKNIFLSFNHNIVLENVKCDKGLIRGLVKKIRKKYKKGQTMEIASQKLVLQPELIVTGFSPLLYFLYFVKNVNLTGS